MASDTDNPLASFLAVPGATTTKPVSDVKLGFTADFADEARTYFDNFHYQMGGDHALYYNLRLSELLPTAVAVPAGPVRELEVSLDPGVGAVTFTTDGEGELTLDEYVAHPHHRVQGLMIAHQGRIVYQAYPGMQPSDHHVWMSAAKSTVGLVFAQLEAEGAIDLERQVVDYVEELAGTHWDGITVLNALNMALGLQLEETLQSIVDPTSLIVRFFSAEFGQPVPGGTDVEHWMDVVKLAQPIDGEAPGTRMRYASATTTVLNYLVERLLNKPWTDVFAERVWSKLGARGPAYIGLTPEGTAVAHGLVSTTLEDFARYAIAFTPSWDKVANERIVSDEVLPRLQTGGNPAAYRDSATHASDSGYFGEEPQMNSFQFDSVFADGALFKHGNLAQGIYIDPGRDVVGVYFSTNGYVPPYGEDKAPGFIRRAARLLAGG